MENSVKRWLKRLTTSISLAIVGMLCLTLVVLATPGGVTDFVGTATDTTISLTWVRASSSNTTVIRYATTTYPATTATGTLAYNGTALYTTVSGLTAGANYYFSAWGYDGSAYGTVANLVVTTLPSVSDNTSIPILPLTIPAVASQNPDTSGWSIHPIDDILDYFADPTAAHGGLGMPVNNVVMFMSGMGVTFVSLGSYIKWRSFFTSWSIALILCCACSSIEVMQWIVVGYLLLVGAGVWAVEKSTQ